MRGARMTLLAVLWIFGLLAFLTENSLALDQFGCFHCRECGRTCCLKSVPGSEKRHCWCVEVKEICIPAVRFPWMSRTQPQIGRVRRVRVLKKQEYECDTCESEWVIREVCPACREKTAAPARSDPSQKDNAEPPPKTATGDKV